MFPTRDIVSKFAAKWETFLEERFYCEIATPMETNETFLDESVLI